MASTEQPKSVSADELLAERKRLEAEFEARYTKHITVMFTDLVGSTSIAETHGDISTREMIKYHDDIIRECVKEHQGVLVKTLGDGTLSYFENTLNALEAAILINHKLTDFNQQKKIKVPISVRVGINYGEGIVEEQDIYGDVVNVAARLEAQAESDEIYLTETAYHELSDKGKYYARVIKTVTLKGKSKPIKVIKVFYKEEEIELDRKRTVFSNAKEKMSVKGMFRILMFFIILIALVYGFMHLSRVIENDPSVTDTRSKKTRINE